MRQGLWGMPMEWGMEGSEVAGFGQISRSRSPRSVFKSLLTATHREYL